MNVVNIVYNIMTKKFTHVKKSKNSRYYGVYYDKSNSTWYVRITSNGNEYYFKNFLTEEAAADAYDKLKIKHCKNPTALNFTENRPIKMTIKKLTRKRKYDDDDDDDVPKSKAKKSKIYKKANIKKPTPKRKYDGRKSKAKKSKIHKRVNFPQWMRNKVCSSQEWNCNLCNERFDDSIIIDHIKPLYLGGSNHISNLQALCPSCDKFKTNYMDNQVIKPAIYANKNISSFEIIKLQKMKYEKMLVPKKHSFTIMNPETKQEITHTSVGKKNITFSVDGLTVSITK